MHARDADAAEIGKGLGRIAASFEPAREDVGVLESLAGALPGIGQHRVRGIADELDAAAAPILRERPREQAPFRALGHEAEQLLEARLGIGEAQPHLVGIAAGRPAFLDPFVGVLLGDDVHELPAADVIGEEMAARPDPLDVAGRLEHLLRHIAAVEQRTPHHLARYRSGCRRHRARGGSTERTPSAPITNSASTSAPLAKASTMRSLRSSSPVRRCPR